MKNMPHALLAAFVLVVAAITAPAQSPEQYSFTHVAGSGSPGVGGNGDQVSSQGPQFNTPRGLAVDGAGNVYVADSGNHTIRRIAPYGFGATIAGQAGSPGSADGTGSAAQFNSPSGVAVDAAGNVFVADRDNHLIRKIAPNGVVTTVAGLAGASGSTDGSGSAARFSSPTGVAVDGAGNLYIADTENNTIRKITPAGAVSTLAGSAGTIGAADGDGNAASFFKPHGIALDSSSNVYVADTFNSTIRKITPSGTVTTLAGTAGSPGNANGTGSAARFNRPWGIGVGVTGDIFVADAADSIVRKVTPSSVVTTIGSNPNSSPQGLAADRFGNVYVADTNFHNIRVGIARRATYEPYSFATFGDPIAAQFRGPQGVAVDGAGAIYVSDTGNDTIRKISPAGDVSTLAGLTGSPGSADGTGSEARFSGPRGLAVDTAGNVYVADYSNHTIRKIAPSGVVTTLAGLAGNAGSSDGIGSAARFHQPHGVAVDAAGNVFVADFNSFKVRKISPSGSVTTIGGTTGTPGGVDGPASTSRFNVPAGIAVDTDGNVYVSEVGGNFTVRKITPSGTVSTVAGLGRSQSYADGTGRGARFGQPWGLAVDGASNLFVADTDNATIRKVSPAGTVTTIAGLVGTAGSTDATGSAARFNGPYGIAVDAAGTVYVADSGNSRIRVGVPGTPPAISSPLTASVVIGQQFVYQFQAIDATSLAVSGIPPGLTFDAALSAIVGSPTSTGSFSVGLNASNGSGTTNATLTLTVQPAPTAGPVITSGTSATGRTGAPFTFQVITSGGSSAARLNASGLPAGLSFNAVTGVISGVPTSDSSTAVILAVTESSSTATATLQLTFISDPAVPVITSPSETAVNPGQPFSYTIAAPVSGPNDPITYALLGTLPPGLSFDPATGTISGTPTVQARPESRGKPLSGAVITNVQLFASNSKATATKPLVFFLAPTGVVNIATRVAVGTEQNVLIGGFIIAGNAPKKVIVRAIAPSIRSGGQSLPGTLPDPTLQLMANGNILGANDDWRSSQEQEIIDTTVAPSDDRESAIVATLNPGPYTAVISGKEGATGIGVVEVYDLGTASLDTASKAQLANISTRGFVQRGDDIMIGGFIVTGGSARAIVRAVGPSLAENGVQGALEDTTLDLRDGNGSLIVANDDWRTGGQEQQIIDTTVPPSNDRESAVVATLTPGAYTAVVRGKNDGQGVALVEVYALQ